MDDGIIKGLLWIAPATAPTKCGNCGLEEVAFVKIANITMPKAIKPGPTLIAYDGDKPVKYLGITCGCYAKFHRQVTHIQGRMKK